MRRIGRCPVSLSWSILVLLSFVAPTAGEPPALDPEIAHAVHTLRAAGFATNGPDALAFIRTHTLSEDDMDHLGRTIRLLGSSEYREREKASRTLVSVGRPALPYLRLALRDADLEIARRARRCIAEIPFSPNPALLTAAAQIVKHRPPPGATAGLLASLAALDETLEDVWFDALLAISMRQGRPDPALLAALTDKRAIRRAAAAHVLGRMNGTGLRHRLTPLLTDSNPRVRYEAAAALVRSGEKKAIPVLIALLADAPFALACQAETQLYRIAGSQGPATALGNEDAPARRACQSAWVTWWHTHGDRVDLSSLKRQELPRGLTVVCEYDGGEQGGRVWEWGRAGEVRWEIARLEGPNDVQVLPGGRVLIAERNANRVTERDHQGKILWQHRASGNPIACQRLPNGNTLVATFSELYEVDRQQKKIFTHTQRTGFRHAVSLPNGHIVFITGSGLVVELDADGKREIRKIRPADHASGAKHWASIEPLPNGHYLLALSGANRVIEIDAAGEIHWQCEVPSVVFATRLPNGHTLAASFEGRYVIEIDRAGKEVRKRSLRGRPFAVRRY